LSPRSAKIFSTDRCREIEEIPEGLETGNTKRRKRGNRSDRDCVDEICDLVAQGITAMARDLVRQRAS
jgi:hypothetical protein